MKWIILSFTLMISSIMMGQSSGISSEFQKEIDSYLDKTISTITVEQVSAMDSGRFVLLDAREKEEFETSTIPGSQYIGYDDFDVESISHLPKGQPIIVFCSIGYRSEKIGEKLKEAGYGRVFNLYGSIFAWANAGLPLHTPEGTSTEKLHTYNKKWSKWVENPKVKKVW
ncbi:MAG: rhodanese-like domain-containing protein [Saprospiraceae bacterium]|nr:rhodanese-like domain-containing protein [Saprospiraceae bacterium]